MSQAAEAVDPIPTPDLRCYSFHSVKGGVGKTTFSLLTALYHAVIRREKTLLIDMDLTGTSLADVLPLEAPNFQAETAQSPTNPHTPIEPLQHAPTDFLSREETLRRIRNRHENGHDLSRTQPSPARWRSNDVPFINDFLLYAGSHWDASHEAHPEAFAWRYCLDSHLDEPYPLLRISPSSALPPDLYQLLPLIYDEPYACFVESRLEWFIHQVLSRTSYQVLVFDTPPSIPGLSRSVLSLGLRLPRLRVQPDLAALAPGGGTPPMLLQRRICWHPCLVTTGDLQDLRAVERWHDEASLEEQEQLRILVNRLSKPDMLERQLRKLMPVTERTREIDSPQAHRLEPNAYPILFDERTAFNLFLEGHLPESSAQTLEEMIRWLMTEPGRSSAHPSRPDLAEFMR